MCCILPFNLIIRSLPSFLVILAVFSSVVQPLHSEIRYTIVNKTLEATLEEPFSETYYLDINGDGNDDFGLYHFYPQEGLRYGEVFSAKTSGGNEIHVDEINVPVVHVMGDDISASLDSWLDTYTSFNANLTGNWPGGGDKYIAIRFKINNAWHYGWIRVNIPDNSSSITITGFAYDDVPGAVIKAGDIGTGIERSNINMNIDIYCSGQNLLIDFKDNVLEIYSVNIFDSNGALLKNISVSESPNVIYLGGFGTIPAFVVLDNGVKRVVKKILIR